MSPEHTRAVALLGFVVVLLLVVFAGRRAAKARLQVGPAAGGSAVNLDRDGLAYLAGGPRRTVNAALAALATGPHPTLQVSATGTVTFADDGLRRSGGTVDYAVLARLRPATRTGRDRSWSVPELRWQVAESIAMADLRQRLIDGGLLATEPMLTKVRTWLRVQLSLCFLLLPWPPIGFGAIVAGRLVSGVVGFLLFFAVLGMVVGAALAFIANADARSGLRHVATRAGAAALAGARTAASGQLPESPEAVGRLVALSGVGKLPDTALKTGLSQPDRDRRTRQPGYAPVGWAADPEGAGVDGGDGGGGDGGGGDGGGGGG